MEARLEERLDARPEAVPEAKMFFWMKSKTIF
jgi:hypothetical protein